MDGRTGRSPLKRSQFTFRSGLTANTSTSSLILATKLRDSIIRYVVWCFPHEGLGVFTTRRAGSAMTAVYSYPGQNMDPSPWRYTMAPADVLLARVAVERDKRRLGAIVHFRPNMSTIPSRTDFVQAKFPVSRG